MYPKKISNLIVKLNIWILFFFIFIFLGGYE
jgi:hypothetical protein